MMPALRDYFLSEAGGYLGRLTELAGGTESDVQELFRLSRGLRGTAQVARQDRTYRGARALENAAKALQDGALEWSDDVHDRVRQTVEDLGIIIAEAEPDAELDARVDAIVERWDDAAQSVVPAEDTATDEEAPDSFREFAAREVEGIERALEEGLGALAANPMDREAFKAILRRQRVLLGAARLDEIQPVAQALRAIEDIGRIIAKMNVAIKDEWYDVFRCARQVMRAAREPLERGEDPPENNALRRLRTYREELLDRYGDGEAVSAAAPASDGLVQAQSGDPSLQPPADVPVPPPAEAAELPVEIGALQYDGEAALRRALELRSRVERAVEHDPDALAAVDEVFDLIRLALR